MDIELDIRHPSKKNQNEPIWSDIGQISEWAHLIWNRANIGMSTFDLILGKYRNEPIISDIGQISEWAHFIWYWANIGMSPFDLISDKYRNEPIWSDIRQPPISILQHILISALNYIADIEIFFLIAPFTCDIEKNRQKLAVENLATCENFILWTWNSTSFISGRPKISQRDRDRRLEWPESDIVR